MIEEKLNKIDDMSRSIDRISHDVENLKIKFFPPKVDISESIKSLYVSMVESKERTARSRAKREFLEKVFSPVFCSNGEDIKLISVYSIESLFSDIKLDDKVT